MGRSIVSEQQDLGLTWLNFLAERLLLYTSGSDMLPQLADCPLMKWMK